MQIAECYKDTLPCFLFFKGLVGWVKEEAMSEKIKTLQVE